jgi:hypothetical protein
MSGNTQLHPPDTLAALPATQRALLQLLTERQVQGGAILVLAVDGEETREFSSAATLGSVLGGDEADPFFISRMMACF